MAATSENIGGLYSKLGNRYEAKWLVLKLLEVLSGKARSLKVEGVGPEFAGFEAAVGYGDCFDWHQTKINAPNGNWTLGALRREGVLDAFKRRLEASPTDRCWFISQDPVRAFRNVPKKARSTDGEVDFQRLLNKEERDAIHELARHWGTEPDITRQWLARCIFEIAGEDAIQRETELYLDWYFEDAASAFAVLRDHIEQNFNKTISTEKLRSALRSIAGLKLKPEVMDPTILERIRRETVDYLKTYVPFGADGHTIERSQTTVVHDLLSQSGGPTIVLLTGVAGSGKSEVVRGVVEQLEQSSLLTLAFRVDQHLACKNSKDLGIDLTGRAESPALTLARISPGKTSVLVIDQVDAISEVSGRNGAVRETVLRLLDEAHNLKTVRVLLVCRTFDLDNDARLKTWKQAAQVIEVGVPLLDWTNEVQPFLVLRGASTGALTAGQKDLLCLPLNLALFLEASGDDLSFVSRNDLFLRLLTKKERAIAQDRVLGWTASAALAELARWMSDRQRLDAPASVLDRYPRATDLLASEHLVVNVREKLNLFHESFFDFLFARQFVHQRQSLHDLLMSTEQHLFRRTQTRQILEALRQADRPRYLRELTELVESGTIRFHIKNVVALWLGTLRDPTSDEFNIVYRLDDPGKGLPLIVRDALLGSSGWFDLLAAAGWIDQQLESVVEERREAVFRWLDRMAAERPNEIADLLERWWGSDTARGRILLGWFRFVSKGPGDEALERLCELVIRNTPIDANWNPLGKNNMLLPKWVAERREHGGTILRALFDAWFKANSGRHPFERDIIQDIDDHWLSELAKTSPEAFLEGAGPALVTTLTVIAAKEAHGERDYTFDRHPRAGEVYGADAFLALYRSSLCQLAADAPEVARGLLTTFDPSLHLFFRHLHLETIAASRGALGQNLVALLSFPDLGKAGWAGVPWLSLAKAAKASLPCLAEDERKQLEAYLIALNGELSDARDLVHEIRKNGEDGWRNRKYLMHLLSRSGHARWCVLKTVGPQQLSATGQKLLDEGDRKFRGETVPEADRMRGGWVHSPIARERAAFMSDVHWLKAMKTYDSGRKEDRRDILAGGPSQLAGELQHLTKTDPHRFVALMPRIPYTANAVYIDNILGGLAESIDVVTPILKEAVLHAHGRSVHQHASAIVRIFERHPSLAEDAEMMALLFWYAKNAEIGADAAIDIGSEKDIVTIDDLLDRGARLHVRGINGPRGAAMEALGQVLWQVPSAIEQAWTLLDERIACEQSIAVRCCMTRPLTPLFNADRQRCAALFEKLPLSTTDDTGADADDFDRGLAPLATYEATRLMPYFVHQVPEAGRRLVDRLLASRSETFRRIGAWHAIGASFSIESYAGIADLLVEESVEIRRLAAATAAGAAEHQEFRGRAESWLKRFFDDPDKLVRGQAADVFRGIESTDFGRFVPLAKAFLDSLAAIDSSWSLLHALESATCDTHGLVVKAAVRLTTDLDARGTAGGRHMSELHTLQDLIRRDYAASEGNAALRTQLLDVIDRLLSGGYYGVEAIIKAHERS